MSDLEHRFARIEADLLLLKWMVGTSLVVMLTGFVLIIHLVGHGP